METSLQHSPEQVVTNSLSSLAWRRFSARIIDSFLIGIIIGIIWIMIGGEIIPSLTYIKSPDHDSYIKLFIKDSIGIIILEIIIVCINSLLLSRFGTTPGKKIMGISIYNTNGELLTFAQALKRELQVLIYGSGLGLYLLGPICMIYHYIKFSKEGITSWDKKLNTQIKYEQRKILRRILGWSIIILFIAAIIGSAILEILEKSATNKTLNEDLATATLID